MIRRRKSERAAPDETELRLQARLANMDALRPRLDTPAEQTGLRWPGAPPLARRAPGFEDAELAVPQQAEDEFEPVSPPDHVDLGESHVDGNVSVPFEAATAVDKTVEPELAEAIEQSEWVVAEIAPDEAVMPAARTEAVVEWEAEAVVEQEQSEAPHSSNSRWDALLAPSGQTRSPLLDAIARGAGSVPAPPPPTTNAETPRAEAANVRWDLAADSTDEVAEPEAAAPATAGDDDEPPEPIPFERSARAEAQAHPPSQLDSRWNPRPIDSAEDLPPPAPAWQPRPIAEPEPPKAVSEDDDRSAALPIDARRFFRPQRSASDPSEPEPPQIEETEPLSMQPEEPNQTDPSDRAEDYEPTPIRPSAPWARGATPTPPANSPYGRPSDRPRRPSPPPEEPRDSSTMSPEELEREFKAALAKFSKS